MTIWPNMTQNLSLFLWFDVKIKSKVPDHSFLNVNIFSFFSLCDRKLNTVEVRIMNNYLEFNNSSVKQALTILIVCIIN